MSVNRKNNWGIIGNITGRFVKNKKGEQEFMPSFANPNATIKQLMQSRKDKSRIEIMESEGLVPPALVKDQSSFKKSRKEKSALKALKNAHRRYIRGAGFNPNRRLNVSDPMVIKMR